MNPFKRKNDQPGQAVVLDTSGLIDGRIVEIARAGFIPQNVVVPQFVIAELQFLADHGDTHKRERARYGLDVIRELQELRRIDVSIARNKLEHIREVDDKLVALAKQYGALLYTTDFNLNKVAQIEGVVVLNVNELAQALRPNLLPGEKVIIKLTQVGQDKTQGVGYLGDGTMVVVEQGSRFVGQQVQAICTRILQTQAGKMMFATLADKQQSPQRDHKTQNSGSGQSQPQNRDRGPAQPQKQQQEPKHPEQQKQRNTQTQQLAPVRNQKVYHAHPQDQQQRRSQRDRNSGNSKPQQPPPQPPKAQQLYHQNDRPRSKRRTSPEDSLIATLKEIQD